MSGWADNVPADWPTKTERLREQVQDELRKSRAECGMYGHDWDVADVMAVLVKLDLV